MAGLERQREDAGWRLWQQLTQLLWMLRPQIEPLLRDAGVGSPLGLFVCRLVEREGPQRLTDLARSTHLPLSTVSGLCDRLVADGFLRRVANPRDRRSVVLEGTERACQALAGLREAGACRFGALLAGMDEGTLEGLIAGLTELVHTLEDGVTAEREGSGVPG